MKPKLVVKTTKGRQYLQLITMYGQLIHIGPADKTESWTVGIQGLTEAYEGYAFREALTLNRDRVLDSYKKHKLDARNVPEQWKRFTEKRVTAKVNEEFLRRCWESPNRTEQGFSEIIHELVDYRTNIEGESSASGAVGVSFDAYHILTNEVIEEPEPS